MMTSQQRFTGGHVQLERDEVRVEDECAALYRDTAMFAAGKHELTSPIVSSTILHNRHVSPSSVSKKSHET